MLNRGSPRLLRGFVASQLQLPQSLGDLSHSGPLLSGDGIRSVAEPALLALSLEVGEFFINCNALRQAHSSAHLQMNHRRRHRLRDAHQMRLELINCSWALELDVQAVPTDNDRPGLFQPPGRRLDHGVRQSGRLQSLDRNHPAQEYLRNMFAGPSLCSYANHLAPGNPNVHHQRVYRKIILCCSAAGASRFRKEPCASPLSQPSGQSLVD